MGGLAALAGGSVLSDPQRSLRVTVFNHAETRRRFHLLVASDGAELVRQSVDAPAGEPNAAPRIETTMSLGELADGTRLDVTAWVADGPKANAPPTLDCGTERDGDAVTARIQGPNEDEASSDDDSNSCYSEKASSADSVGETNITRSGLPSESVVILDPAFVSTVLHAQNLLSPSLPGPSRSRSVSGSRFAHRGRQARRLDRVDQTTGEQPDTGDDERYAER